MNKAFTPLLLMATLIGVSSQVTADTELNRCLATNKVSNRYQMCYRELQSRAIAEKQTQRRTRSQAITQRLEAEQAAAKEQEKKLGQGQAGTPGSGQPPPRPVAQPMIQPAPTPPQPRTPEQPRIKPASPTPSKIPGAGSDKDKSGKDSSYPIQYY